MRAEQVYLFCRAVAKSRHYEVLPQKCGALRARLIIGRQQRQQRQQGEQREQGIDDTQFRCCLFRPFRLFRPQNKILWVTMSYYGFTIGYYE